MRNRRGTASDASTRSAYVHGAKRGRTAMVNLEIRDRLDAGAPVLGTFVKIAAPAVVELKKGMTFTIEPMINAGKPQTRQLPDGWTVVTKDPSLSAQWRSEARRGGKACVSTCEFRCR